MVNMAPNSLEEFFTAAASLDNDQRRIDQSIENIVKRELARGDSACMLARIGEFVVRATRSLSKLTDALVVGNHIDDNTDDQIEEMVKEDEFSDLEYIDYLEKKHAVLRRMKASIHENATQIENLWKASPNTPQMPAGRSRQNPHVQPAFPISINTCWESERASLMSLQNNITKRPANSLPEPERFEMKYETKSPQLEDDSQGTINELLISLASRGKGKYLCPLGSRCGKSGVASNGELVVFERNSAFRAHLEKHGRRYKCDIPGCKNRDGFARKDQLNRHKQETVFHGKPGV